LVGARLIVFAMTVAISPADVLAERVFGAAPGALEPSE
jgi:hypothetical protein